MQTLNPFPRSIPKPFNSPRITLKNKHLLREEDCQEAQHGNILRDFIPKSTKIGDVLPIFVGEIYDPSKFWIYIDDGKLDTLMDELQKFYFRNQRNCLIPEYMLKVGVYCVSLLYGEFYRVVIIGLPNNRSEVKVYSIDYGTVLKVKKYKIWTLHNDFFKLPAQAMRARLTGIYPLSGQATWSQECCVRFRDHCSMKKCLAEISKIDWEDEIIEVSMKRALPNSEVVNTMFVTENLAQKFSPDVRKHSFNFRHMFPKFSEIESGSALSALEIHHFLEMGLTIDMLCPKYFYRCSDCVRRNEVANSDSDDNISNNQQEVSKFEDEKHSSDFEKLVDVDIFEGFPQENSKISVEVDLISEFLTRTSIELHKDLIELEEINDTLHETQVNDKS